jgi:hypothetical protein
VLSELLSNLPTYFSEQNAKEFVWTNGDISSKNFTDNDVCDCKNEPIPYLTGSIELKPVIA